MLLAKDANYRCTAGQLKVLPTLSRSDRDLNTRDERLNSRIYKLTTSTFGRERPRDEKSFCICKEAIVYLVELIVV